MARTRKAGEIETKGSPKKSKIEKSPITPKSPMVVDEKALNENNKLLSEKDIQEAHKATLQKTGYYYRAKPEREGPHLHSDYNIAVDTNDIFVIYRHVKENKKTVLGAGGTSTVKIAQNLMSGEWVVMKTIKPLSINQNTQFEAAASIEVEILKKLGRAKSGLISGKSNKSPNLQRHRLFMEIAKGETLFDLINNQTLPKDGKKLLQIADNFIEELLQLYKHGYLHRDIKIENIFVDLDTNKVTLIDFGSASEIDPNTGLSKRRLFFMTPEIKAPEVSSEHYSIASDVYSAGKVLLALLLGITNTQEKYQICDSENEEKAQICNLKDETEVYYELDNAVYDIIYQMIKNNPAERPTLEEISHVLKKSLAALEPPAPTPSP